MKKFILIIFFMLISGILTGCGANTGKTTIRPVVNNPQDSVGTSTNSNESVNIGIQNFSFNPPVLTIKQGTIVTWTNNDSAPHQIKADSFISDLLSQGQSFTFTFKDIGKFDYICSVHPSMSGSIIVK